MSRVRRGDLFWADPGPVVGHEQAGHRPVLVLSDEVFNARLGVAIVVPVTSRQPRQPYPITFPLSSGGLPKKSWVLCWQVRTVSVLRLGRVMGRVDEEEVDAAADGLCEVVGR